MNDRAAPELDRDSRAALVAERIEQVRQILGAHGADGVLLDSRRDFAWLTVGGQNHILYTTEVGVAPILITRDDAVVIAPVNEFDRIVEEEIDGQPLRVEKVEWLPGAAAGWAARTIGSGRLASPSGIARDLVTARSLLVAAEHVRMEWLGAVVLETVEREMARVRIGISEDELVADVTRDFAAQGVRLPVVLIAADDRIARYRHPISASKPIQDRVMLVVVAERWGLHVAHTQFRELTDRSAEITDRAQRLAHVLAAVRSATVPGNTLGDVIAVAQDEYERVGLHHEWTLHHQGGTIGYQAREQIAAPADATPIQPGMAFAWNPSAQGYKLEETLYLDADGRQHVVTTTPV